MNKSIFLEETKHLLYWWIEWLKRFLTTSYHLFNRRAYHDWLKKRKEKFNYCHDNFGLGEFDNFD